MIFWCSLAFGAALGSMLRYWCTLFWPQQWRYMTAVFVVNMVGCATLTVLAATNQLHCYHDAVSVAFLGGLTTFSSMIAESSDGRKRWCYLVVNVAGGLVVYWLVTLLVTLA